MPGPVKPLKLGLADQLFGRTTNGRQVIVVQRWTGFAGGKNRLVVSHNAIVSANNLATEEHAISEMALARQELSGGGLALADEDAARALLREIVPTWEDEFCQRADDCGTRLPIGGPWCPECSMIQGRTMSGAASGSNRRRAAYGEIHFGLRK